MRKLQKELLNKKMSLHQALMSMDVLNPDYDKLKREVVRETVFGMEKELSIDESVNVKFDYEII